MNADIIDEHIYRRPELFLVNAKRYDYYDRNGSKRFADEYAAQSDKTFSINNNNNCKTALSEAAFFTGMERRATLVYMASYAPLFAHVDGWQWTPDLIWVNKMNVYGTPNNYVQKLFSVNKGTDVIPIKMNGAALASTDSSYASSTIDENTKEVIIKIVNASGMPVQKNIVLQGVKKVAPEANFLQMQSKSLKLP